MFDRIRIWARAFRRDGYAVYLAARDPNAPWHVRGLAVVVAAYAFSPLDLVPDFIPIPGYLDDLILIPVGIWLVVSLIPDQAMAEYRAKASEVLSKREAGLSKREMLAFDLRSSRTCTTATVPLGSTLAWRSRQIDFWRME